eukprot:2258664-Pyramimonas_sp.AAC.1
MCIRDSPVRARLAPCARKPTANDPQTTARRPPLIHPACALISAPPIVDSSALPPLRIAPPWPLAPERSAARAPDLASARLAGRCRCAFL